jgi:hypothetical protein
MTNIEKLVEKVTKHVEAGMKDIHFSWASDADKLTPEERAAEVLKALEEMERIQNMTREERILYDMRCVYEYVKYSMEVLSYNRLDKISEKELQRRVWVAWGSLDMVLCLMGNWIKMDDKIKKHLKQQFEINKVADLVNMNKYE